MKRAFLTLVISAALALLARGQQHQNAFLYTHFHTPATGVYSIDQYLRVDQRAPASFWPVVWKWEGEPVGGYFGLQTSGSGPTGQQLGDTAIFSLWNANAVDAAPGSLGGTFGGEGTGFTVRRAYPFRPDRFYRLRIWRLGVEVDGNWWGAWIQDTRSGVETYLGRIRSEPAQLTIHGQSIENFSEYFGPAMPTCSDVPLSIVRWSLPLARHGGGEMSGAFSGSFRGSCTGGASIYSAGLPPLVEKPIDSYPYLPNALFPLPKPRRRFPEVPGYLPNGFVTVSLGGVP